MLLMQESDWPRWRFKKLRELILCEDFKHQNKKSGVQIFKKYIRHVRGFSILTHVQHVQTLIFVYRSFILHLLHTILQCI